MNRSELEEYITNRYGTAAEHPWEQYPEFSVFRRTDNKKWFAVIMKLPADKFESGAEGTMSIMNLKCGPVLAGSLRLEKGYYPAYHMNKANWISIRIDSVPAEDFYWLLDVSWEQTANKKKKADT